MDMGNILGILQDRNLLAARVDRGRMPLVRVGIAVILLDTTVRPTGEEHLAATNILQIAKASCCDLF
jgi:hypothetical protein